MYKLGAAEIRLIKKYNHDIDVIKVICNDAYNTGSEDTYKDAYDYGFSDGYSYRVSEEHNL